jgi:hypothetical protein
MLNLYSVVFVFFLATNVNTLRNQPDFISDPNFSALRTCGHCCLGVGSNCTSTPCIGASVGCDNNTCLCSYFTLSMGYLDPCVRAACTLDPEGAAQSYKNMFSSYCQSLSSTTTSATPTGKLSVEWSVTLDQMLRSAQSQRRLPQHRLAAAEAFLKRPHS